MRTIGVATITIKAFGNELLEITDSTGDITEHKLPLNQARATLMEKGFTYKQAVFNQYGAHEGEVWTLDA